MPLAGVTVERVGGRTLAIIPMRRNIVAVMAHIKRPIEQEIKKKHINSLDQPRGMALFKEWQ